MEVGVGGWEGGGKRMQLVGRGRRNGGSKGGRTTGKTGEGGVNEGRGKGARQTGWGWSALWRWRCRALGFRGCGWCCLGQGGRGGVKRERQRVSGVQRSATRSLPCPHLSELLKLPFKERSTCSKLDSPTTTLPLASPSPLAAFFTISSTFARHFCLVPSSSWLTLAYPALSKKVRKKWDLPAPGEPTKRTISEKGRGEGMKGVEEGV